MDYEDSFIEIVHDPYNELSHYPKIDKPHLKLKSAIIVGRWKESYQDFIENNNIEALYLNYARGWLDSDYKFLSNLKKLKLLDIIAENAVNIDCVQYLEKLEYLKLDIKGKFNQPIYFSKLTNLRQVSLIWDKNYIDLFNCFNIKVLSILNAKGIDTELYENLADLQELMISNSDVDNLSFLKRLNNIEKLELFVCKKILDFNPIGECKNLQWLSIDGCPQIKDINFVQKLTELQYLNLSNNKSIESIKFVEALKSLKAICFVGNTWFIDGDLSCLEELPKLAMVNFNPRKSYSHKIIKPWNWSNFDIPDKILEKC